MTSIPRLLFCLLFLALPFVVFCQGKPVGYWRAHMPYNTSISVASDGKTMFVATEKAFYTYDIGSFETEGFSKVEGMSDVGMAYTGYDAATQTVVLAYTNGNIDLFKDNSFYNIPDLKQKSITGSKNINHIYTEDGLAYLSTDAGIIVINLEKREVKETYVFTSNSQTLPITCFSATGTDYYATTTKGLYRISRNAPNLQAFSAWTKLDTSRNLVSMAVVDDRVFVTGTDSLFSLNGNSLQYVFRSDTTTRHLDPGVGCLWLCQNYPSDFSGQVKKFDLDGTLLDSFKIPGFCKQVLQTDSNTRWIANEFGVMLKQEGVGQPFGTFIPESPSSAANYDVYANNKEVYVAHGGFDDQFNALSTSDGFSVFKDEKWTRYRRFQNNLLGDTLVDFIKVIKGNEGNVYLGSAQSGLLIIKPDGSTEVYKQNSFIDPSSISNTWYRIAGFAFDSKNNLWMTVYGGKHELAVRTAEGKYYTFIVAAPRSVIPNAAADLVVDDNDQKWYATTGSNSGVIVYNDNGTPENPTDDSYRQLLSGKGYGGLPDNEVYCVAKDKTGAIWIGTKNGIGIVNCPASVIEGQCEAEVRVVQYDQFAGYLFDGEQVRTIAVDGANRKWIGTNNGVWLISSDASKIISRFTAENSPLPSNFIQKISIDPVTGDVYIGTEQGLMCYRGTATDGGEQNSNVLVFPNPVPSGYPGTIAIKGLVDNADVRITDISGQLVYRTRALGGQAVWNGKDYTGHRPQTGVYLVFITNKDGSQTHVGKIVFME